MNRQTLFALFFVVLVGLVAFSGTVTAQEADDDDEGVIGFLAKWIWFIMIIVIVINLILAFLVHGDAKKVDLPPVLWFVFCFIGGFIGLILYALVRKNHIESGIQEKKDEEKKDERVEAPPS